MKTIFLIAITATLVGCRTNNDSVEARATREHYYRHSEPYSKEPRETIEEGAGSQTQSREGFENPFIQPRAGEERKVLPANPAPPAQP